MTELPPVGTKITFITGSGWNSMARVGFVIEVRASVVVVIYDVRTSGGYMSTHRASPPRADWAGGGAEASRGERPKRLQVVLGQGGRWRHVLRAVPGQRLSSTRSQPWMTSPRRRR